VRPPHALRVLLKPCVLCLACSGSAAARDPHNVELVVNCRPLELTPTLTLTLTASYSNWTPLEPMTSAACLIWLAPILIIIFVPFLICLAPFLIWQRHARLRRHRPLRASRARLPAPPQPHRRLLSAPGHSRIPPRLRRLSRARLRARSAAQPPQSARRARLGAAVGTRTPRHLRGMRSSPTNPSRRVSSHESDESRSS
jgi:hypothetical protein